MAWQRLVTALALLAACSWVTLASASSNTTIGATLDGPRRLEDRSRKGHHHHRSRKHKHKAQHKKPAIKKQPPQKPSSQPHSVGLSGIAFQGKQGPGIASWYQTDSGRDSTNGHSWCGIAYNDWTDGFAPDVNVMLSSHGWNREAAATAYCGLEAIVKTPDGKSKLMYIVDGFDHRVRTEGSIDVIHGPFGELFGGETWNKNDVIHGVSWVLTGNRHPAYAFHP